MRNHTYANGFVGSWQGFWMWRLKRRIRRIRSSSDQQLPSQRSAGNRRCSPMGDLILRPHFTGLTSDRCRKDFGGSMEWGRYCTRPRGHRGFCSDQVSPAWLRRRHHRKDSEVEGR